MNENDVGGTSIDNDPIWTSSKTARQIHALGGVEKVSDHCGWPSSTSLQGDERSEQFVLEVTQYFETLDSIQYALRACLAQLRKARVSPASIDALPPGFVPPTFGVGSPENLEGNHENKGLQELRVERDAWKGVLDALQRLKAAYAEPRTVPESQRPQDEAMDVE
ncbi:hypothetical protein BU17DRAFT_49200 [Hysterangium stoloniferum]|nr:hypothetical protein BU17DRAFT_49200 [Hysterangium stoloniferum]